VATGARGAPREPARGALSFEHVLAAARAAAAKSHDETVILDVGPLIGITDYFVVASGRNDRQVRAIVDEVSRRVRQAGGAERRTEGLREARWVLLDYGDFVVHVFDRHEREYYGLERLWSDARRVPFDGVVAEPAGAAST
jgi:ribosome-associated protein